MSLFLLDQFLEDADVVGLRNLHSEHLVFVVAENKAVEQEICHVMRKRVVDIYLDPFQMVKLFVTDSVLSTQTLSVNMPKFVSFRLIARIKCGNRATPLVQVSDADRLSCSISKFMLAPS